MDKQQSLFLKKYTDLLYRWKVLLVVLLLISLPLGLVYYVKTPKVYMASSLLSYQQQKVSPNKMSPEISARIKDILGTLTQIVTSRTNLEGLITTFDLYRDSRETLPMEDVIEMMRKNIEIMPSKRGDIFSITFSGNDPGTVVKVTNALAAKFIEENLKYREERASETSAYTSNELSMAKSTMDKKEAAMRDYKLKYYNEMPQQRQLNVSRLTSLQEQYQGTQESILDLENTRVLIHEQIANRKKVLAAEAADLAEAGLLNVDTNTLREEANSGIVQLKKMRVYLDSLLVKYTENHPEVRKVRRAIEKLENELQVQAAQAEGASTDSPGDRRSRIARVDADILQLQTQLKNIQLSIQALENEKKQLEEKIQRYEEWIAAAPVREAEWSALTREYNQLKSHYDYLVAQDLQAKSMLNLERRQKGSQFKVEDPARFPEKPIKPDFLKIMAVCIGGALGGGAACVLLIDFLDGAFRDPEEIESYLGIPVLTTVGLVSTVREKRRSKVMAFGVACLLVIGFMLVAGLFWYAWSKGKIAF